MYTFKSFEQNLFRLDSAGFEKLALEIFHYQAIQNPVYKQYIQNLNIKIDNVKKIAEIPFLPISFFKRHTIKSGSWKEEAIFRSSGTTGQTRSQHFVKDLNYYKTVATEIFNRLYGPLQDFTFLALLPSYLERADSSLIYMVDHFIEKGGKDSGFYLNDVDELVEHLKHQQQVGGNTILLGVTFALLDLAEKYDIDLSGITIMETGGMKGRKREMVRNEVHAQLKKAFRVSHIHSEYGMTELLSQAYAKRDGNFSGPPWMKVLIRDLNDPFDVGKSGVGGINVVDLANIDTCCFVETQDIGTLASDETFQVLGRVDNSEIRGCNLLISNY